MATRFSFFLTPAADDCAYAGLLIREIGAAYDAPPFEPHVTLHTGPFSALPPLREAVAAAVAGVPPLTLRVMGVGCSAEYFKTLYIEFEESPLLSMLHGRLRAGCGDSGYELHPHLSLLYGEMPLREKEALAQRVQLDRTEFHFDEVKIVVPRNADLGWRDTGQWQTLFRARLRGGVGQEPGVRGGADGS